MHENPGSALVSQARGARVALICDYEYSAATGKNCRRPRAPKRTGNLWCNVC